MEKKDLIHNLEMLLLTVIKIKGGYMEKKDLIHNLEISLDAIYQINATQENFDEATNALKLFEKKVSAMGRTETGVPAIILCIFLMFPMGDLVERFFVYMGLPTIGGASTPIFWITFVISVVLSCIAGSILRRTLGVRRETAAQQYREKNGPALIAARDEQKALMQRLIKSENVQIMQQTVPADYASVDAVSFFIMALNNQRADVLKEAINLYESEKHNREMLDMQQKELELLVKSVELSETQLSMQQKTLKMQEKSLHTQNALLAKTQKVSKQVRFSNAMGVINTVRHWKN